LTRKIKISLPRKPAPDKAVCLNAKRTPAKAPATRRAKFHEPCNFDRRRGSEATGMKKNTVDSSWTFAGGGRMNPFVVFEKIWQGASIG
jgi:hypothetical protein